MAFASRCSGCAAVVVEKAIEGPDMAVPKGPARFCIGPDATLATLAYRLYQFWLPIPAGAIAYIVFKRRYGKPEVPAESATS